MTTNGNGKDDERDSGMSIEFLLSVGYKRRRPDTQGDRWETRMDSLGLMLLGGTVTVIILALVIPKVIEWVLGLVRGVQGG